MEKNPAAQEKETGTNAAKSKLCKCLRDTEFKSLSANWKHIICQTKYLHL